MKLVLSVPEANATFVSNISSMVPVPLFRSGVHWMDLSDSCVSLPLMVPAGSLNVKPFGMLISVLVVCFVFPVSVQFTFRWYWFLLYSLLVFAVWADTV